MAQEARESARAAGMAAVQIAIRADARQRPVDERGHVFLAHRDTHHALAVFGYVDVAVGVGAFDQPLQRFGVGLAALLGDLRHAHADVSGLGCVFRKEDAVGVCHVLQRVARGLDVVEIALGENRGDRRIPVGVGVDISGDVEALGAPVLDALQHGGRLAPAIDQRDLQVRELHADLCLAGDGGGLVLGLVERHVLAAYMAGVEATRGRCHFRQRHQLRRVGVDAGVVFQPARETKRAGFHVGCQQRLHAFHFVCGGDAAVVRAHHSLAHRAVPGERGVVDCGGGFLAFGEPVFQRELRAAVHAHDRRGDALRCRGAHVEVWVHAALVVAVRIDKARREHQALCLHHRVTGARLYLADAGDETVA